MSDKPANSTEPADGTPHHQPGFRFRRGQNWMMLGLTYASYYTCRYNLSIVAPRLMDQFGFTNAQYGAINTARDLSYAVGQFINGLLTSSQKRGGLASSSAVQISCS